MIGWLVNHWLDDWLVGESLVNHWLVNHWLDDWLVGESLVG